MYEIKTSRGADAGFIFDSDLWRDIKRMLDQWRRGEFARKATRNRRGVVQVLNNTGRDVSPGELLQIQTNTLEAPTDSGLEYPMISSPIVEATDIVWHTAIDGVIAVTQPILDGEMFPYEPRPFGAVYCTGGTGRYVMIDPATPKHGRLANAGLFRVIGYDATSQYAVVDFSKSQPYWRYVLTQDSQAPAVTTAKLVDPVTGSDFSSTAINLSDATSLMDDQVNTNVGWCMHVCNTFQAVQAPCTVV